MLGSLAELERLYKELKKKRDLEKHMLEVRHGKEVEYLNRVLRRGEGGSESECDPQNARTMLTEYGMVECRERDPSDPRRSGEAWVGRIAPRASGQQGISVNCHYQLHSTGKTRPVGDGQGTVPGDDRSTIGTEEVLKQAVRCFFSRPRGIRMFHRGKVGDTLHMWTERLCWRGAHEAVM